MTEHDQRVLRVLEKQLNREDKHRATGRNREDIEELINQLKTKASDTSNIHSRRNNRGEQTG